MAFYNQYFLFLEEIVNSIGSYHADFKMQWNKKYSRVPSTSQLLLVASLGTRWDIYFAGCYSFALNYGIVSSMFLTIMINEYTD